LIGGKDRSHRDIYPDIGRAELPFDFLSSRFDLVGVGNIRRQNNGLAAKPLDITLRPFQSSLAAREQADACAFARKSLHRRAPHPGGCAGHDDRPFLFCIIHRAESHRCNPVDACLWEGIC
jgi:hypothetical protein